MTDNFTDKNAWFRTAAAERANAPRTSNADLAQTLYGSEVVGEAFSPAREAELFDATGATEDERAEIRDTFTSIHEETGLDDVLVRTVANGYLDHVIARAHAADRDEFDAAVNAKVDKQNVQIRAALRSRYGDQTEDVLARTQAFARAHRRLAEVLTTTGLGSDQAIVEKLAAHVVRTGWGQ